MALSSTEKLQPTRAGAAAGVLAAGDARREGAEHSRWPAPTTADGMGVGEIDIGKGDRAGGGLGAGLAAGALHAAVSVTALSAWPR